MSSTLNDLMNNLLKISDGDVGTFTRRNDEFTHSITHESKIPAENITPPASPQTESTSGRE